MARLRNLVVASIFLAFFFLLPFIALYASLRICFCICTLHSSLFSPQTPFSFWKLFLAISVIFVFLFSVLLPKPSLYQNPSNFNKYYARMSYKHIYMYFFYLISLNCFCTGTMRSCFCFLIFRHQREDNDAE